VEILGTEARISAIDFTINAAPAELTIEPRSEKRPPDAIVEQFAVPDLYADEVNHFSDCIINNREPVLSALSALHNQRVLDAVMNEKR
jgi:predicted dehydrogenase